MAADVRILTKSRLRVKQRLAVVQYVQVHGIKPAARCFRARATHGSAMVARLAARGRTWAGAEVPEATAPADQRGGDCTDSRARTEHEYGAGRTRIWLERVHRLRLTTQTIQRVFRDIGLPYFGQDPAPSTETAETV